MNYFFFCRSLLLRKTRVKRKNDYEKFTIPSSQIKLSTSLQKSIEFSYISKKESGKNESTHDDDEKKKILFNFIHC